MQRALSCRRRISSRSVLLALALCSMSVCEATEVAPPRSIFLRFCCGKGRLEMMRIKWTFHQAGPGSGSLLRGHFSAYIQTLNINTSREFGGDSERIL